MINKQGLIFLTLTSLILVLSVYYITMPTEILLTTNETDLKDIKTNQEKESVQKNVIVKNTNTIAAMKSLLNDERLETLKDLNNKLINKELSIEEKNNIYEEIKVINKIEAIEEEITRIIKSEYNLDSFVKVKDDIVEITINSSKHDTTLAAKIMTSVEKKYHDMYISVSFKE